MIFTRIGNLVRGFLSLFISGLEKQNPEALLEVEKENLRRQIGNFNQGLASHAALCEKLMTQVKRNETLERELRAKTTANLQAGNREAAEQFALRYQTAKTELEENRRQLADAEKTYKELIRARDVSIKAAQTKIEALKNSLSDLKIKRATAELAEMASGMVTQIGGSGDTLNRLQTMVEEERDLAAGKARVAKDTLDFSEIDLKESEQKALASQALADFAAAEGISLPGQAAAPAEEKDMGSVAAPQKTMGETA